MIGQSDDPFSSITWRFIRNFSISNGPIMLNIPNQAAPLAVYRVIGAT